MGILHVSDEQRWKQAYLDALAELEPKTLCSKVQTARTAIENRLLELGPQRDEDRAGEVNELANAQRVLRYLSKEDQQF